MTEIGTPDGLKVHCPHSSTSWMGVVMDLDIVLKRFSDGIFGLVKAQPTIAPCLLPVRCSIVRGVDEKLKRVFLFRSGKRCFSRTSMIF